MYGTGENSSVERLLTILTKVGNGDKNRKRADTVAILPSHALTSSSTCQGGSVVNSARMSPGDRAVKLRETSLRCVGLTRS